MQASPARFPTLRPFWSKVDKTLRYHGAQLAIALRRAHWQLSRPVARQPIIVLGCSRAGTTLVYKTLSESREIGSLQRETHDFWVQLHPLQQKNWDTHGLDAADAGPAERGFVSRYFYAHTGHHRWVDKNNQNGLCVPYLHALFPDAVFVYVKRSPGDNLNSLIEGWDKPEEFATWSDELPAQVDIEGRYKKWCFFLAPGWRDYLAKPVEEVCAFQYRSINQAILDASMAIPSGQWVEVYYEDILRAPVEAFRKLFQACSLGFDARLEAHCAQVLDIPYNAFSEIRLDKWKDGRNRDQVARALPLVAEVAKRMGYVLA
jgi:hypothetical protein